jgi:hypothetical protein
MATARLSAACATLAAAARVRRKRARAAPPRLARWQYIALVAVVVMMASALIDAAAAHSAPGWLAASRRWARPTVLPPTPVVVVRSTFGTPTPTIPEPAYNIGAWVSDSAPPPTGTVQVYVRVSDFAQRQPVAQVGVSLQVQFTCASDQRVATYGPLPTDVQGIAAFAVAFAGLPPGQPVCITAITTLGGQTYTAGATFAAS